jgi:hypothetical protein
LRCASKTITITVIGPIRILVKPETSTPKDFVPVTIKSVCTAVNTTVNHNHRNQEEPGNCGSQSSSVAGELTFRV